ncbi:toll-like receptor 13 [Littorina saxatilis]|uniref:TIR domain-containing protein n=1 Tax=Littorina saxatilis TaxID=31220 RepID=A0AAN9BR19_9CAEN
MGKVYFLFLVRTLQLCVCRDDTVHVLTEEKTERVLCVFGFCCGPPQDGYTSCGEGYCRCRNETASCAGHFCQGTPLHFIPALPSNISTLNFACNNLVSIDSEDFFENVTGITSLDLSCNSLVHIHPDAFRRLSDLTYLYLDGNTMLSYPSVRAVFLFSYLERLSMNWCGLGRFSQDVFYNVSMPRLENIDLNYNQLLHLDHFHNTSMPHLQVVTLYGNQMETINLNPFSVLAAPIDLIADFNRLAILTARSVMYFERLVFGRNLLTAFPNTCDNTGLSLYPYLRSLVLYNNNIYLVPQNVCLPNLETLDLTGNPLGNLEKDSFTGINFPSLTEIFLSGQSNFASFVYDGAFSNLTALKTISLNTNYFSIDPLLCNVCSNCPQLSILDMSSTENKFPICPSSNETRACENITWLDLSYSNLVHIPKHGFVHCFTTLTRLVLSNNRISSIPDGAFDGLPYLAYLDLSYNQLSVVGPDAFNDVTRQRFVQLYLAGNTLQCSCDLMWFQAWMKASPSVFREGDSPADEYKCDNMQDIIVTKFVLNEQACMLSKNTLVMIIYTITIAITTLTIASAVFRSRWHLRLLLYEVFRGRGETRRQRLLLQKFDFDVFVSHDSDDSLWVRKHLMSELEDRLGLRLCLHERDFIPGRDIVDNIATMVQSSKKVLMVFSNAFVASQWCQFELSFCLQHAMDTEDALIIVCVDDVASRDLTAAMMAVLKTTTYIQWLDGDGDAIRAFWGRLRFALHEIFELNDV